MTSLLGSGRRCHFARAAVALASSLDFLQGTFEEIHLQGLHLPKVASSDRFPCGERTRAGWAATLLVLAQSSPVFCATCTGTSVVPRVLALTHRHRHKS